MHFSLTPRSVGLVLATVATAGWIQSVITRDAPVSRRGPVALQTSRGSVNRLHAGRSTDTSVPSTARLRDFMSRPTVPAKGRNPFVYGERTATRSGLRDAVDLTPMAALEPPPPAMPVFRLSGIASNAENGVAVLTAILIDNGTMVLVKAGDKLSNGYSVVRVEEAAVTIADSAGVVQSIRLP